MEADRTAAQARRREVLPLVVADLTERIEIGTREYGSPLAVESPNDALRFAYEEALDLALYLRQELARRSAIPADVPADDAEMWCERCGRRHGVVWFASSEVWDDVMREGDRGKPDECGFCCPVCFMQLADERGVGTTIWEVRSEVVA